MYGRSWRRSIACRPLLRDWIERERSDGCKPSWKAPSENCSCFVLCGALRNKGQQPTKHIVQGCFTRKGHLHTKILNRRAYGARLPFIRQPLQPVHFDSERPRDFREEATALCSSQQYLTDCALRTARRVSKLFLIHFSQCHGFAKPVGQNAHVSTIAEK